MTIILVIGANVRLIRKSAAFFYTTGNIRTCTGIQKLLTLYYFLN